jgi:hypothetical protein
MWSSADQLDWLVKSGRSGSVARGVQTDVMSGSALPIFAQQMKADSPQRSQDVAPYRHEDVIVVIMTDRASRRDRCRAT